MKRIEIKFETHDDTENMKDKLFPPGTKRRAVARRIKAFFTKLLTPMWLFVMSPYYSNLIRKFPENMDKIPLIQKDSVYFVDDINDHWLANIKQPVNVFNKNGKFVISGWAVDPLKVEKAGGVFIKINGHLFRAHYGLNRPDVARVLKQHKYRHSGFRCTIDSGKLDIGEQHIDIIIVDRTCSSYYMHRTPVVFLRNITPMDGCYNIGTRRFFSQLIGKFIPYEKRIIYNLEAREKFSLLLNFYRFLALCNRILARFKSDIDLLENQGIYPVSSVKEYCSNTTQRYFIKHPPQITNVYEPRYFYVRGTGSVTKVEQPEIYIAELTDVAIIGQSSVIITPDNHALLDLAMHPQASRYNLRDVAVRFNENAHVIVEHTFESEKSIEKGIMLSGTASINYYHWMFEFISRLSLLENGHKYPDYPLIVDRNVIKIPQMYEALNFYSGNRKVIPISPTIKYRVGNLVLPSYMCWSPLNIRKNTRLRSTDTIISKQAVSYLRNKIHEKFQGMNNPRATGGRKIYISRKDVKTNYRVFLNEAEIVRIFQDFGFETVFPEKMSFFEQCECYGNASIIAGATGAGLTNTVFAPENCKIICLINQKIDFSAYSGIAGIVGQEMIFIDGDVDKSTLDTTLEYQACFKINADKVTRLLSQLFNNRHESR